MPKKLLELNFDPSLFAFDLEGIEFICNRLKSGSFSLESKQIIFNKWIEAVFALQTEKSPGLASILVGKEGPEKKNPIISWYKGKFSINKTETLKELEKIYTKQAKGKSLSRAEQRELKKFDELEEIQQKKITTIKIGYAAYQTFIEKPKATELWTMPVKIINHKVYNLALLLQSIVINSGKEELLEDSINQKSDLYKIFEFYINSVKIAIKQIEDKDIKKIEDKEYILGTLGDVVYFSKYFTYSDQFDLAFLLLATKYYPSDTLDMLIKKNQLDLLHKLCSEVIKSESRFIQETKNLFLEAKLQMLHSRYHDEEFKKIILEYNKKEEFRGVIKNIPFVCDLTEIFNQEEISNIFGIHFIKVDLQSSKNDLEESKDLEISSGSLDYRKIIIQGQLKPLLLRFIADNNKEGIQGIIRHLLKYGFNTKIFLDYILDNISLSSDPSNIFTTLTKLFKNDLGAQEEIAKASNLYKFLKQISRSSEELEKSKLSEVKSEEESERKEKENLLVKIIDQKELAQEALEYISHIEEVKDASITIEESDEIKEIKAINKAYQLQKKLVLEQKPLVTYKQEWNVEGIKYIYSERIDPSRKIPENESYTTKVTTSFGCALYVCIAKDLLPGGKDKVKFESAIDHWAGSFYNKSGIKAIFKHGEKDLLGYEVKIMSTDARLFTNQVYENESNAKLLIFDQLVNHDYISHCTDPIEIISLGTPDTTDPF